MNRPADTTVRNWLEIDSTLIPALVSSVLCWLAFPPVGLGFLAWLGPIGWLSLVQREELSGSRPYRAIWLSGFVFWVLAVHWIRLPHPANYLALTVLASYLGCYLPAFVALARLGVHRLRLPLWIVAPIVWTGLDWFRHHLLTGFGFGSLAHTQAHWLEVVQIADLVGEYGVTCLIVLVSACLTMAFSYHPSRYARPLVRHVSLYVLLSVLAVGSAYMYGALLLQQKVISSRPTDNVHRIALIQGNTLADWKGDANKQQQIMEQYMGLSLETGDASRAKDGKAVDLFIWPETTFRQTLATVEAGFQLPPDLVHPSYLTAGQTDLAAFVEQTGSAILTGIDRVHIYPTDDGQADFRAFNSSVLMDSDRNIVGTYDKMHRVPFGEYIPFAEWFPILYQFTPLTGGVSAGAETKLLQLGSLKIAPNICYETCVPHLVRRQANPDEGEQPDVLVNLTNDAWYWGSSELDMHLACGVFRAVENHVPLLIAANGGLSAHVGPSGAIHQVTQRQQPQTLLVEVRDSARRGPTFYALWGDWFAGICVVCCVVLAVIGWRGRASAKPADASGEELPRG